MKQTFFIPTKFVKVGIRNSEWEKFHDINKLTLGPSCPAWKVFHYQQEKIYRKQIKKDTERYVTKARITSYVVFRCRFSPSFFKFFDENQRRIVILMQHLQLSQAIIKELYYTSGSALCFDEKLLSQNFAQKYKAVLPERWWNNVNWIFLIEQREFKVLSNANTNFCFQTRSKECFEKRTRLIKIPANLLRSTSNCNNIV